MFCSVIVGSSLLFYFHQSLRVVKVFLVYRRLCCSSPPLNPPALRGQFLRPKLLKYFRRALVASCSFVLFHGFFALFLQNGSLSVLAWIVGTVSLPGGVAFYNYVVFDSMRFLLTLPDSLFEHGLINQDELERFCGRNGRSTAGGIGRTA